MFYYGMCAVPNVQKIELNGKQYTLTKASSCKTTTATTETCTPLMTFRPRCTCNLITEVNDKEADVMFVNCLTTMVHKH